MAKRRKNPWLNPRTKKMVKGTLRVTKKGTTFVEPHLHEYPKGMETKETKKRRKKEKPKEELQVSKKKREEQIKQAKEEMACRLGV